MIELNGRRLGLAPSLSADYEAFHEGAALIDLSDRGRMRFLGAGARGALNGILTCDIAPLAAGQGAYGVALTNKGKVVADVSVFAMEDSFLVECPASAWPNWQQLVAKYINPRISQRRDETAATASLGLFGPKAAEIAGSITGSTSESLEALPMYSFLSGAIDGTTVDVARIPDMGVDGYRLLMPTQLLDMARARALELDARSVGTLAAESARIEAGRPVWGIDMDDNTIPQEANLEALNAISYTKGCYTGQEVVARLHFRGHVNKRLMGLRIEGSAVPERASTITSSDGKNCGDIRSAIVSPRFGSIALGMIRREVAAGDRVTVSVDGSAVTAEVASLPFGG